MPESTSNGNGAAGSSEGAGPGAKLRFQQIRDLFEGALDLAEGEREQYLSHSTSHDTTLREEVLLLLRHHDRLRASIGSELPWFGPYRATRVIARGGEGLVYEAVRGDGEYDRRVAIKVLAPGTLGVDSLDRLRAERQILAKLSHPGIAQLFDGGVTDKGEPYLVVEYVPGEHLDDYCNARALNGAARLQLFESVLDTVEHAHRSGVVHRDLKPSNIMVTAAGATKLVDFGTAGPSGAGSNSPTRALTPDYASPEMLSGDTGDERSDVYALGVIYRDLLGASARRSIVRRATAAQPADRYQTVADLHAALRTQPWRRWMAVASILLLSGAALFWGIAQSPASLRNLTPAGESWRDAAISADGRTVAYLAQESDVYIRSEGGPAERLLRSAAPARDLALSPDGRYLAYRSAEAPAGIREFDRQTKTMRLLIEGGHRPAYSPNGQALLYATSDDRDDVFRSRAGIWRVLSRDGSSQAVGGGVSQIRSAVWETNDSILFQGARAPGTTASEVWRYRRPEGSIELAARWDNLYLEICALQSGTRQLMGVSLQDPRHFFAVPLTGGSATPRLLATPPPALSSCIADGGGNVFVRSQSLTTRHQRLSFEGELSPWQAAPPPQHTDRPWLISSASQSGNQVALFDRHEGSIVVESAGKIVGRSSGHLKLSGDGAVMWDRRNAPARLSRLPVALNSHPTAELPVSGGVVSLDYRGDRALGFHLGRPRYICLFENQGAIPILRHPVWDLYRGVLSRDQRWVAFTARDPARGFLIFLAPFRGSQAIDPSEWMEVSGGTAAAFHPSGRQVYFVSDRDGWWCIYSVSLSESMRPITPPRALAHLHGPYTVDQMPDSHFALHSTDNGLLFSLAHLEHRLLKLD